MNTLTRLFSLAGLALLCSRALGGLTPEETVALNEMAGLETALEIAYIDTGFFVALEALDDQDNVSVTFPFDYIYNGGGTYVLRPERGRFEGAPLNPIPNWMGPYIIYQPSRIQQGPQPYDRGSPLDPWGHPYLLFSPLGLLRGDTGAFTGEYYGDQFDRYAIVSLGTDGTMSGDDLIRLMGIGVTGVTTLATSSIVGQNVFPSHQTTGSTYVTLHDQTITIRGYKFGSTQGTSKVFFGTTELTTILSWSDTAIIVQLPPPVFGVAQITVQVGVQTSNPLQLNILPNQAAHWELYD